MYLHFCFYFFHFNKVTGLLSNSNLFANEMLPCDLQGLSPNCVVPKPFFVGSPKISYSFEQSLELYGTSLLFLLINMYNLNMHVFRAIRLQSLYVKQTFIFQVFLVLSQLLRISVPEFTMTNLCVGLPVYLYPDMAHKGPDIKVSKTYVIKDK